MTITTSFVGRPNFTPRPYLTLQFFVYRFDRFHFKTAKLRTEPFKTAKLRTEPFKTEFYAHILLYTVDRTVIRF